VAPHVRRRERARLAGVEPIDEIPQVLEVEAPAQIDEASLQDLLAAVAEALAGLAVDVDQPAVLFAHEDAVDRLLDQLPKARLAPLERVVPAQLLAHVDDQPQGAIGAQGDGAGLPDLAPPAGR